MMAVDPYIEQILCFASTVTTPPNRLYFIIFGKESLRKMTKALFNFQKDTKRVDVNYQAA